MKFGIFYEHQLPRPWEHESEYRLLQDSLAQIELAESTQSGLMGAVPDQPDATPATPALARFRESIAVLLPAR